MIRGTKDTTLLIDGVEGAAEAGGLVRTSSPPSPPENYRIATQGGPRPKQNPTHRAAYLVLNTKRRPHTVSSEVAEGAMVRTGRPRIPSDRNIGTMSPRCCTMLSQPRHPQLHRPEPCFHRPHGDARETSPMPRRGTCKRSRLTAGRTPAGERRRTTNTDEVDLISITVAPAGEFWKRPIEEGPHGAKARRGDNSTTQRRKCQRRRETSCQQSLQARGNFKPKQTHARASQKSDACGQRLR